MKITFFRDKRKAILCESYSQSYKIAFYEYKANRIEKMNEKLKVNNSSVNRNHST